ncbi:MAG TPA: hypothetical protein VK203_30650 [Nostocaceae cyanobacterium]|nr:hypothetical protein [Nostocaceae cyanobacterium]
MQPASIRVSVPQENLALINLQLVSILLAIALLLWVRSLVLVIFCGKVCVHFR